jgi:hypothetical protein
MHNNTKSTKPWNSPNEASSILQEIQLQQGWRLRCSPAHRMQTSHATDQTQTSHSIQKSRTLHITSTHYNTKSKVPWYSPNQAPSILQEIKIPQGW